MTFSAGIATTYQVKLPVFEGPLDLLLRMIQARKLDVSLVSLAAITSDYVARVKAIEGVPASDLTAFILVAAQLVAVKSRLLLPSARDEREEEPGGEELLRRLHAYEQFKLAAAHLADRQDRDVASYAPFAARPSSSLPVTVIDVPHVTRLGELIELAARPPSGGVASAPAVVAPSWIAVETCITIVRVHTAHRDELTFAALIGDGRSRDRIVGLFLALLHLWKWGELEVTQEAAYADIRISRRPRERDAEATQPHEE